MLHIAALVGNVLTEPSYLNTSHFSIGVALCFSGHLPLEAFELLFGLPEGFGVKGLSRMRFNQIGELLHTFLCPRFEFTGCCFALLFGIRCRFRNFLKARCLT